MAMQFDADMTATSSSNVLGDQLLKDPFSLFAQMRVMGAVLPAPFPTSTQQKAWMVIRMQEALQVLKDSQRFTLDYAAAQDNALVQRMQSSQGFPLLGRSMLDVDGLAHRRLRGLVSEVFTPKYIGGLRPSIEQIANRLLDQVAEEGCMDLVEDYAYPLPINVISDMLGVPHNHWDLVREGSKAIVAGAGGRPITLDDRNADVRAQKIDAFGNYIAQLVAEKRHHPQSDLISQLVQIEEDGDRLSEPELLSMVGLLLVAGHETTSNLIGSGMLALLDHADQLERLKADLSLVPRAIEELLRFIGPVLTSVPRLATEEVDLGGQHISRGDIVIAAITSANHDESHFTHAAELDLLRSIDRHLAFGYGIHTCLGAPLARLEGEIAFTTLLRRMPNLRLNAPREALTWHGSLNVRGLTHLPVAF
ncbi:cytochrome P450 family protein [Dictyobacter formicarum]|uniref:Polyketide biosynthesis cytochrome P450 PksS n=1 Tax=Dictyobacter formicarum TaxID=2778368 RepID=A0ABQ3V8R0_9CHLR|nr:cytochrome P450 [Dictyobacter formicarum]GHO82234.1 polyketide biosynthesis cytochrome P450 PksS [Dictyobacter formicarum]